jgi:hypothetical protein
MRETTESFKDFTNEFRRDNSIFLEQWKDSSDPLRRAAARIIMGEVI